MKRRQDNSDDLLLKMKSKQEDRREVSTEMKRKRRNEDRAAVSTKMKINNEDIHEHSDEPDNSRVYRTTKRRKGVSKEDPECSPSTSSDDSVADSSDSSSWDSWETTDSDSVTELPGDKSLKNDDVPATVKVLEEIKKEENIVVGELSHFWASQVAPKARKELGKLKTCLDKDIPSLDTLKTRCDNVEKLMQLPCVISVGFKKDHSKFTVIVSDRKKAVELSEELTNPNIDLVEGRYSHLM